jgi:hypothetical protein
MVPEPGAGLKARPNALTAAHRRRAKGPTVGIRVAVGDVGLS